MTEVLFDDLECDDCNYNQFSRHPDGKHKKITRVCNGCGDDLIQQRKDTIEIAQGQIRFYFGERKNDI